MRTMSTFGMPAFIGATSCTRTLPTDPAANRIDVRVCFRVAMTLRTVFLRSVGRADIASSNILRVRRLLQVCHLGTMTDTTPMVQFAECVNVLTCSQRVGNSMNKPSPAIAHVDHRVSVFTDSIAPQLTRFGQRATKAVHRVRRRYGRKLCMQPLIYRAMFACHNVKSSYRSA